MTQNKMTGDFADKPKTFSFFKTISGYVESLGTCSKEIKSQVSYAVKRKFIWLWAYDKTPDGTLYVTVCVDKPLKDPLFHYVNQVSAKRWNHHIEVKSAEIANSEDIKQLIRAGYEFACK